MKVANFGVSASLDNPTNGLHNRSGTSRQTNLDPTRADHYGNS